MKKNLLFIAIVFATINITAQTTISLTPSQDNTLFESSTGALSSGAGQYLFAGRSNQSAGSSIRRAVLQFDLSSLPTNITINSASLTINVSQQRGGSHMHNIHVLTNSWGESTSVSSGSGGGQPAPAATGDATWLHRFSATQNWTTAGGDFSPTSSASTSISANGAVSFASTQLTADVQAWIDGTTPNHGWIIIGDESSPLTAKRFASKEDPTASVRPTLSISYNITGITEIETSTKIMVYPNPAQDYIIIENRKNMFEPNVIVHDIEGKEVLNQELQMDNKVNISDLKTGVYFVELISRENGERIVKKIVKQ